ncbi:MAG: hypothetical protein HKN67_12075 [Saprospiraceae bacterium]|nr:hypothetical protein [Bacteroidia bacterium]MBT8230660.1 hypothetical protein [Bacteroidia bacterium]NNF22671.1 hypothetical protein [Saprospiraceae bacterium]NNK90334.1 hypothetical protein [Saprospiraceae bacterium]
MRPVLFAILITAMISCGGSTNSGGVGNLEGYTVESIPQTNVSKATKKNAGGQLIEQGFISGGKRNGVWITYYDGEHAGKIKTMASYSDGLLSGPYLELSNRGQIETEVNYANNKYNGRFAKYKFGRAQQESFYKDNQLDGPYREYSSNGKLQKEIYYKGGVQHGMMRYFNEEGQTTVQYEYKNGEKISGGMIDRTDETQPEEK